MIDGRNTGSVTGNTIDNTKSAISIQYTDGTGIAITGNSQGADGNEWGENLHLNGYWDGSAIQAQPGGDASAAVQTQLLADAAANNGWTVQDQAYATSNRTAVTVDAAHGSDSNQGSPRAQLASIQAGLAAVVSGGTVNVDDGTYVVPSGSYIDITKSVSLIGESEAGTIIDASNASTYGLRVQADDVDLENFTLNGQHQRLWASRSSHWKTSSRPTTG